MITGTATVTYLGGESETLHVIPFDWMRYERWCAQHKIKADPREAPASWGIYLAYSAHERAHAHNGNAPVPGFDTWAASVDELDLELNTPDPTMPEVPAE